MTCGLVRINMCIFGIMTVTDLTYISFLEIATLEENVHKSIIIQVLYTSKIIHTVLQFKYNFLNRFAILLHGHYLW